MAGRAYLGHAVLSDGAMLVHAARQRVEHPCVPGRLPPWYVMDQKGSNQCRRIRTRPLCNPPCLLPGLLAPYRGRGRPGCKRSPPCRQTSGPSRRAGCPATARAAADGAGPARTTRVSAAPVPPHSCHAPATWQQQPRPALTLLLLLSTPRARPASHPMIDDDCLEVREVCDHLSRRCPAQPRPGPSQMNEALIHRRTISTALTAPPVFAAPEDPVQPHGVPVTRCNPPQPAASDSACTKKGSCNTPHRPGSAMCEQLMPELRDAMPHLDSCSRPRNWHPQNKSRLLYPPAERSKRHKVLW